MSLDFPESEKENKKSRFLKETAFIFIIEEIHEFPLQYYFLIILKVLSAPSMLTFII